jgi:Chlorophyll A-B binding protein
MLGVLGMVVPEFVRVPGEAYSFEAIPRVIDAHDKLPDSMIQIFGWISFIEAVSWPAVANMNVFDREPGNFGFDPLKLMPKDEAKANEMRLKELKNGRLAMVAVGGMVAGALVTGKPFPYL